MSSIIPSSQPRWWRRIWLENPVILKELRSRMRGRRAFVILTIYLALMGGLISLVYWGYISGSPGPTSVARDAGKFILAMVLAVEVFLVAFIAPSFTAGSISGERERQTFDLLRTTLLTPSEIVWGKLVSALSYVLLLLVASIPLQGLAFLLGGVDWLELLLAQLLVLTAAVVFALVGLWASAVWHSTLSASVATYLIALGLTFGLPLLVALLAAIVGNVVSSPGRAWQIAITYALILAAALNLPAALIVSDIFLVQDGSLWAVRQSLSGSTIYVPSPWYLFLLIYLILGVFFFRLCVGRIKREGGG